MTTVEEIGALAATFAEEAPSEALTAHCKAAETELCARLRRGVLPESCRDALIPAAAWLALSYRQAVRCAQEPERFSVADLSVQASGAQSAQALRAQAEALMAPYLEGGFAFRGV